MVVGGSSENKRVEGGEARSCSADGVTYVHGESYLLGVSPFAPAAGEVGQAPAVLLM